MAIPAATNAVCNIYRANNAPPSAPDVANVPCTLTVKGASDLTTPYYTHVMLVATSVDIRDDYSGGQFTTVGTQMDKVYFPSLGAQNEYRVVIVRRVGAGTALDHKQVLLKRETSVFPANDV